jgi:hypothetical protein
MLYANFDTSQLFFIQLPLLQLELLDHADDSLHVFNWRSRDDAVPQVEDVAGASVGGAQNLVDPMLQNI